MDISISIVILGIITGFMVGLTGVGGAALLTPILVMVGIHPSVAVGTDLFYNSITKLFGTIQHYRQKTIDFQVVKYFAYGSLPGAVIAVSLLRWFGDYSQNEEQMIKTFLGFMLIIVAASTIIRTFFDRFFKENRIQKKSLYEKKTLTICIGATLGFVVGMTSIGSGSLFALALMYLYRLSGAQVVGTDIAHAFLLVSVAGLLHAGLGHVDYTLTFNLLIGSIPGVLLGSTVSAKVPTKPLRAVVATIILISGIKLI